ncbi:MAG: hypothetical protein A3G23_06960 [Bacteroidetes bacterium RIFCSPLOWO2_12_FULL_37_12]|nr:MAG: hypothetical protein A3G23_06960 [Bacteroidetes bacterium RIFCSPLOWO2_12_FULL_37_12]
MIALLLGIFSKNKKPDINELVRVVQKNMDALTVQFSDAHGKINKFLSVKNPEFSDFLNLNLPVSCYIFDENKSPVFWNDPTTSFPFRCTKFTDSLIMNDQENGTILYLTQKIEFNEKNFYVCLYKYLKFAYSIQNNYVKTHLDENFFPSGISGISTLNTENNGYRSIPISFKKQTLFYIQANNNPKDLALNHFSIFLLLMSGVGFCFSLILLLYKNNSGNPYVNLFKIFILLIVFLLIRFAMLFLNFPFAQTEWELFNPANFAISSLIPSLGDLIVTLILLCPVIWYLFVLISTWILSVPRFILIYLLATLAGFCLFYFLLIEEIYLQPLTSFRFHEELTINYLILFALLLEAFTAFFILTLFLKILTFVSHTHPAMSFIAKNKIWLIFSFLIITAFLHTLSVSLGYKKLLSIQKTNYAGNLLSKNDFLSEYYIHQAGEKIINDPSIQSKLSRPAIQEDFIIDKIKNFHLNRNFDKYEVDVRVYRQNGNRCRINSPENYFEEFENTKKDWNQTEYAGLYLSPSLLKEQNNIRAYRYFLAITSEDSILWPYPDKNMPIGYILLNFRLNRGTQTSIMPRLFYDEKQDVNLIQQKFDYAIIESDTLIYSTGNMDVSFIQSEMKSLNNKISEETEMVHGENIYFFQKIEKNNFLVLSAKRISISDLMAVFSFYFIFPGIILTGLYFLFSTVFNIKRITSYLFPDQSARSFSFKIQLYLLIASFFPLLIVLVSSVLITFYSHKSEYLDKISSITENMTLHLPDFIENYTKGSEESEKLNEKLKEYRQISGLDINLFSRNGFLTATTQPLLYQLHFKPEYVNPVVFGAFQTQIKNKIFTDESVGKLHFSGIYIKLKSRSTNQFSGIVYIPYFASDEEINKELASVISTILIIYVPVFILLIIFGNIFSGSLVIPLKLLTGGLQEISLTKQNKPLTWKSADEIGILVNQYNSMLEKLEESKQKLSQNERELAWKEVAQKVAHEIKNPLTPMRLNLQLLERAIKENHPDVLKMTNKAITTLLTQIDIINEIASSFSKIARLPSRDIQNVNLEKIITEQSSVFINSRQADIKINIERNSQLISEFDISADPKELMSVFSNLLINSIQSVEENIFPIIEINLYNRDGKKYIQIKDNGRGMDNETKLHAFERGFTTKKTGAGIGLALCKNIIENMGGKIEFETEVGKGTVFRITFVE